MHNIFTTNTMWQVVIGEQKSNFSCEFKLKLETSCYLRFIMKILWT